MRTPLDSSMARARSLVPRSSFNWANRSKFVHEMGRLDRAFLGKSRRAESSPWPRRGHLPFVRWPVPPSCRQNPHWVATLCRSAVRRDEWAGVARSTRAHLGGTNARSVSAVSCWFCCSRWIDVQSAPGHYVKAYLTRTIAFCRRMRLRRLSPRSYMALPATHTCSRAE